MARTMHLKADGYDREQGRIRRWQQAFLANEKRKTLERIARDEIRAAFAANEVPHLRIAK